jgi:hypothetical protein
MQTLIVGGGLVGLATAQVLVDHGDGLGASFGGSNNRAACGDRLQTISGNPQQLMSAIFSPR